jgi:adenine-specific DNA-methyltransferase
MSKNDEKNTIIKENVERKSYLTKQIITYMGNKRKIIPVIEDIIIDTLEKLNAIDKNNILKKSKKVKIADGFSGSGIVSRLLKMYSTDLYVNDIASYSQTLNQAFLSNITPTMKSKIEMYITQANDYASKKTPKVPEYIQLYWSPKSNTIHQNERAYFTPENGVRIDRYKYFIDNFVEKEYKHFLMAILLIKCSIHNNTNGNFAAFYKKNSVGHFGGKNEIDLKRITSPIKLEMPVYFNTNTNIHVSKDDTNNWIKTLPKMDIVYYDPPYNKHPYNIYYFLLDIIDEWDLDKEIPNTLRGQPKDWEVSEYNSIKYAVKAFTDLITNTNSKFIIISYNNNGIIKPNIMEKILKTKGEVTKYELDHKTYNRMKGIAGYKKTNEENKKIVEYVWVVDCR